MLENTVKDIGEQSVVMALIGDNYDQRQRIFSMGASDYISFPVIAEELLVRIRVGCFARHLKTGLFGKPKLQDLPLISEAFGLECIDYRSIGADRESTLVQKTCRYLLAHLTVNHTLESLAQNMATNRNMLASSFRKVLGRGVFAWLREQRMNKAKVLLKSTDMSIQQICFEVGYTDPANFSTAFKSFFKLAPLKYRKHENRKQQ